MSRILKIGTRGSSLAVKQAEIVEAELKAHFNNIDVEIVKITTKGDKILNKTLDKIGGKGVFVKEIENALLNREIDIAVHSMKDMPGELPKGLMIGAVTKRENPKDVLVSKNGISFYDLPNGAKIGTGSLRRKMQLLSLRGDIEIVPIRGNINTRINKLNEGLDGVVLAAAGLKRNGMENLITEYFEIEQIVPAGCQGILALEIRSGDKEIFEYVNAINNKESEICAKTERAFLDKIGADCHAPVGVYANIKHDKMIVKGMYYTDKNIIKEIEGFVSEAEHLGEELGDAILEG